jgi:hypothetical protein
MSKYNIFLYSPGGYGPHSRMDFWADKLVLEDENDEEDDTTYSIEEVESD